MPTTSSSGMTSTRVVLKGALRTACPGPAPLARFTARQGNGMPAVLWATTQDWSTTQSASRWIVAPAPEVDASRARDSKSVRTAGLYQNCGPGALRHACLHVQNELRR